MSDQAINLGERVLSGENIDWAQMGTDMVRDIIFNLVLEAGGRMTDADAGTMAEADTATGINKGTKTGSNAKPETVLGDAMTEINRVYNKAIKRGKDVNAKIADIDGANNAHVDFASGKLDAGTSAMKMASTIDEMAASGLLKPKETARLNEIRAEVEPYIENSTGNVVEFGGSNNVTKADLEQTTIDRILSTPKSQRPEPSTYLDQRHINEHLTQFVGGVTKIMPEVPSGTIGTKGGCFVMSKSQADELIEFANGDISKLEDLLGFDKGYLGNNPIRVDIKSPKGLRMPSGKEIGANMYWIPGGYTSGGIKEAVIDPAISGTYIVKYINR